MARGPKYSPGTRNSSIHAVWGKCKSRYTESVSTSVSSSNRSGAMLCATCWSHFFVLVTFKGPVIVPSNQSPLNPSRSSSGRTIIWCWSWNSVLPRIKRAKWTPKFPRMLSRLFPVNRTRIKAVSEQIIQAIHIELTRNQLAQKRFRFIFIEKDSNSNG